MLTTDPIYFKPLLPVITIKNTANNTTLYTYNSFTDSGTTDKVLYCSVRLSQNTFGEFVIQFEDQNKSLASTVTVGSRVQIDCGKQSSSLTRLISGLVRKKGYTRGADAKVLYTISGTSTGIRLNERIIYAVSEAARLANGQIDFTDVSRKADTLLASGLSLLTADGILSIANLAANSDVETFITSTNIQYGELQDLVNYYEDQSGGEVVVDTADLVHFRYEIKNNLFGRGFTLKNNNDNKANDDADDTMYLVGKNWTYEDDFYKSSNYANGCYGLLSPEADPTLNLATSYDLYINNGALAASHEAAVKFRPTHSHFLPGDILIAGDATWRTDSTVNVIPTTVRFRICKDNGGVPLNAGGVIANIDFPMSTIPNAVSGGFQSLNSSWISDQTFLDTSGSTRINSFELDTTRDYWLIMSDDFCGTTTNAPGFRWYANSDYHGTGMINSLNASSNSAGGSGWVSDGMAGNMTFAMPTRRSHSFFMYDPKAMQAVSSGLTGGLATNTLLTDAPHQVTTFDSMYRFMSQQTYNLAKPRTVYNFPTVTAPNIPPFPGDPIIINDAILNLSTVGNQVAIGTCGDMTYQWGNQGSGSYEAPTRLSINAIAVHPRYR